MDEENGNRLRALVLEQDEGYAYLYRIILERQWVFQVDVVQSVDEAIQHWQSNSYDVAYIRIAPDHNWGHQLARRIRQTDLRIPLLAASTFPEKEFWPECESIGFTDLFDMDFSTAGMVQHRRRLMVILPWIANVKPYRFQVFVSRGTDGASLAGALDSLFRSKGLSDHYQLEIVVVSEHPEMAEQLDILATPTLVRVSPHPRIQIVGEVENADVLAQLL